jgi:hypothetical protein
VSEVFHYSCAAIVNNAIPDLVSGNHLTAPATQTLRHNITRIKSTDNKGFLPLDLNGAAWGTKYAQNCLTATLPDLGPNCSIAFLYRMQVSFAGTVMRFQGTGGRYIYTSSTDRSIRLGTNEILVGNTEHEAGKWYHLALVSSGSTTLVYLDGVYLRLAALSLVIPAGTLRLFCYDATFTSPGGSELSEIRGFNHALTENEIHSIAAEFGSTGTYKQKCYAGFGGGSPNIEEAPTKTYCNQDSIGGRTCIKFWTDGLSCRIGWFQGASSLREIWTFSRVYIPSTLQADENNGSPGPYWSFFNLQTGIIPSATTSDYSVVMRGYHESNNKITHYQTQWYNSSNVMTSINMTGTRSTELPRDQWFTAKMHVKYDGGIIECWINGNKVVDASGLDFSNKLPVKTILFGLWMDTHILTPHAYYMDDMYSGAIDPDAIEGGQPIKRLKGVPFTIKNYIKGVA